MADIDYGEIHLWHVDLTDPAPDKSIEVLSAHERDRMSRLVFLRDRNRYLRSQVVLRNILAMYLLQDAADIDFEIGTEGKPHVRASTLHFNLSHSADQAVIGLTRAGAIGVDIEERREITDSAALARAYFSASEILELQRLPVSQRSRAFLVCWTRKEALLKATGVGLIGLNRVEVGVQPFDAIAHADTDNERIDLRLRTVMHWTRAIVSIAAPTTASAIRCLQWPPVQVPAVARPSSGCRNLVHDPACATAAIN